MKSGAENTGGLMEIKVSQIIVNNKNLVELIEKALREGRAESSWGDNVACSGGVVVEFENGNLVIRSYSGCWGVSEDVNITLINPKISH